MAGGAFLLLRPEHRELPSTAKIAAALIAKAAGKAQLAAPARVPGSEFRGRFEKAAEAVGSVDPDPAVTERKLTAFATDLQPHEVEWLGGLAADPNAEGDARALAVELLSRNQAAVALQQLETIALRGESAADLFEQVLSARAVEGIAAHPDKERAVEILKRISVQTSLALLQDRAQRGLQALLTGGPGAPEQDRVALSRLLGSN